MRPPRTSLSSLITTTVLALAGAVLLPVGSAAGVPAAAIPSDAPVWVYAVPHFHEAALDWEPVAGATRYEIYRGIGRDTPTHFNTVFASEFRDTTAIPGTAYTYQVAARDDTGIGPKSVRKLVRVPIQALIVGVFAPQGGLAEQDYRDLVEAPGETTQTSSARFLPTGPADWPTVSPDGKLVAHVDFDGNNSGVAVTRLDGAGTPMHVADSAVAPAWSPNGKKLLYGAKTPSVRLMWVPWSGAPGDPVAYPGSTGCTHAAWLPDGSGVVASCMDVGGPRLYRISTAGVRIAIPNTQHGALPAVSPDGTALAFRRKPPSSPAQLRLVTLGGGLLRVLATGDDVHIPAWSPNAKRLYFSTDAGIKTVLRSSGSPTMFRATDPGVRVRGIAVRRWDDTPPWVTLTSRPPQFSTGGTMTLKWRALDSQSGVLRYETRVRRAAWNGVHGAWSDPAPTTNTQKTVPLLNGAEVCIQVRAVDKAGNVSGWRPDQCTARFLDDPALTRKGGWSTYSSQALYGGTASSTGKHGATLGLSGAVASRVALLVTKCPRCGKVDVYWGATKIASAVTLWAGTTKHRQVVVLPAFSSRRTGALRIVKADASPRTLVRIDGVALRGH